MGIQDITYGRLFARIAEAYLNTLSVQVEPFGLDRYFVALLYIVENSGTVTQKLLGKHLRKDKVSILRCVNYLIEQKLVRKKINKEDKRESFLEATDKGKNIAPVILQAVKETNQIFFKDLSPSEFKNFEAAFQKLLKVADGLPEPSFIIRAEKKNNLIFQK